MDYTSRLEMLLPLIKSIKAWDTYRDLLKLYRNMEGIAKILSIESVECRRIHKPTATFISMDATFNEQYSELEQWITFAMLL